MSAAQQTHEPFRYDLPGFMSSERKCGEDRNAFTLRRRGEESKRTSPRTKGSTIKGDDGLVRVVPALGSSQAFSEGDAIRRTVLSPNLGNILMIWSRCGAVWSHVKSMNVYK